MKPRDAQKAADLRNLAEDNYWLGDYWILHSGNTVTIAQQQKGSEPTQSITIPRQTFNSMVDWMMREQQTPVTAG